MFDPTLCQLSGRKDKMVCPGQIELLNLMFPKIMMATGITWAADLTYIPA